MYGEEEIEKVKEYKYLGCWMTSNNNWKKHTKYLAGKAQKALKATWRLIKRTDRSRLRDRMYLYNALVRSEALYGVEVWG